MIRPDRRALRVPVLLAVAAALLLALGVPAAFGRITAGLTNNTNTVASNAYYLCNSAQLGAGGNNAYLAYPLNEASGTTATDASGNGRAGTYTTSGVSYRTANGPCKRDGGYAVTLNGSSGYISGPNTTLNNPTVFSLEVWFKTTVAAGKLIGFGGSRTGTSSYYDRHLYIDSTGKLVFGVYVLGNKVLTTPAAVTDGQWHHAVATLSSAGMALYLDGALVGSNTSVTTAQNYVGYWRIGYDNLNNWTNQPASAYFNGDLAWAEVYTYALTAEQVKSHYLAGTGS